MREARSSQGLELVGVITMMMVINWSVIMVTLVTIVTTMTMLLLIMTMT